MGSADIVQILYVVFAAISTGLLVIFSDTKAKFVGFVVIFSMMGGSVIQQDSFILPLRGLVGGNMLLPQFLIYLSLAYLAVDVVLRFNTPMPTVRLPFEKYFYALFIWLVVIITYHMVGRIISPKEYKGLLETVLIVPIIYLLMKRDGDEELVRLIARGLLLTAVITSIVAIIQFTVSTDFLRVGNTRIAFAGRYRSNGIFYAEYTNSYFLVASTIAALLFVESRFMRRMLIGLFLIGIFLSFHRMSWIVTIISFGLYLVYVRRYSVMRIASIGVLGLLVFYALFMSPWFQRSDMVRSRLEDDTITDRFTYYTMVLSNAGKLFWTGAGTFKSSLYYFGMLSVGQSVEFARGEWGGIHNLYLETLFLYGAPTALLYLLMMLSMVKDFHRRVETHGEFLFLPFAFAIAYIVMNLTNSFPVDSEIGHLLGVIAGCGAIMASAPATVEDVTEVETISDVS